MKAYNSSFVNIELKDETKVRLFAENEYYEIALIGSFDFYWNEGYIIDVNGKRKEVKRFSTIMNTLFKQNENLFWDAVTPEQAKQNAKQQKIDEAKKYEMDLKIADEKKASDFIEGIKNNEEKYTKVCENAKNKSDEELLELVKLTFNRSSKKVLNTVFNAIKEYNNITIEVAITTIETAIEAVVATNETIANEAPEVYHLNKNTFNSYNEAFNHAVQNQITTTKILSSKHPSMTTERLEHLESSYVFDKIDMTIEDKKDYFNYLESIPNSLDCENRYYKLRSWIEREEAQQQRQQDEKERIHNLGLEASETLEYMVTNGLEIVENESMVKWYLKDENVYTWFSGIGADEYHKGVMTTYERYFDKY